MTLHGPYSSVLVEEPVVHLIPFTRSLWEADLVLGIVALDEVLHDASRFEKVDFFAIRERVGECWDASIGVDGQELGDVRSDQRSLNELFEGSGKRKMRGMTYPVLLLGVLGDIDLFDLVRDTGEVSILV